MNKEEFTEQSLLSKNEHFIANYVDIHSVLMTKDVFKTTTLKTLLSEQSLPPRLSVGVTCACERLNGEPGGCVAMLVLMTY